MGRIRLGVAALIVAALFSASSALALERATATDGDTIKVDGESVRVMHLDAPEARWRARCPRERALAQRATERMAELIRDGVTLEPHGREKYGRLLAVVRDARGRSVAEVLIAEGLAVPYEGRGPRMDWCRPGAPR